MIQTLQTAAIKGGEVLRSYFRKDFTSSYKSTHQNLVTAADLKSQQVIKEYLEKTLPENGINKKDIGFIGEEGLFKPGKYLFAIDPLDGTSNFATGFEYFAVSIGVFVDGDLRYGVIYQPIQDIMHYAEKGKGAFRKDKSGETRLKVIHKDLKQLYFSGGISIYEDLRKKQLDLYNRLFPHFRNYISIYAGCPSICLFTENILGVLFSAFSGIWDIAAGHLIVEEAGGVMVDWNGRKIKFDFTDPEKRYPNLSCHPKNLALILELVKGL